MDEVEKFIVQATLKGMADYLKPQLRGGEEEEKKNNTIVPRLILIVY